MRGSARIASRTTLTTKSAWPTSCSAECTSAVRRRVDVGRDLAVEVGGDAVADVGLDQALEPGRSGGCGRGRRRPARRTAPSPSRASTPMLVAGAPRASRSGGTRRPRARRPAALWGRRRRELGVTGQPGEGGQLAVGEGARAGRRPPRGTAGSASRVVLASCRVSPSGAAVARRRPMHGRDVPVPVGDDGDVQSPGGRLGPQERARSARNQPRTRSAQPLDEHEDLRSARCATTSAERSARRSTTDTPLTETTTARRRARRARRSPTSTSTPTSSPR